MTLSPAKTTNLVGREQHKSSRKGERGVTIFIAAVAMVSLLAMAVLAIDIVTLYVASGQAQQAADAAALAGGAARGARLFLFDRGLLSGTGGRSRPHGRGRRDRVDLEGDRRWLGGGSLC